MNSESLHRRVESFHEETAADFEALALKRRATAPVGIHDRHILHYGQHVAC